MALIIKIMLNVKKKRKYKIIFLEIFLNAYNLYKKKILKKENTKSGNRGPEISKIGSEQDNKISIDLEYVLFICNVTIFLIYKYI